MVRLRLDLSPAFFGFLAMSGIVGYCDAVAGGEWLWPVVSAHKVLSWAIASWWLYADAFRRGRPLLPVWGLLLTSVGFVVLIAYLFHSRGAWAWVTMVVYGTLVLLARILAGLLA